MAKSDVTALEPELHHFEQHDQVCGRACQACDAISSPYLGRSLPESPECTG